MKRRQVVLLGCLAILAAFLSLPDSHGCLVTARLPPDDADLTDQSLQQELYDRTPFDPPEAQLRYRQTAEEGRSRCYRVAAIPGEQLDALVGELVAADDLLQAANAMFDTEETCEDVDKTNVLLEQWNAKTKAVILKAREALKGL